MNRTINTALVLLALAGATARAQFPNDSLTLDKAIALALANSASVQGAEQGSEAAMARTRQAESARLPHVEADAMYRRVDPTVTVDFPVNGETREFAFFPNDNYEAGLTAQQNLYDFGRTDALVNLARGGEETAAHAEESARLAVAYQTVQAFNGTLLLERNIAVIDDQISALRENLRLAQERQSAGTATNYDVLSTQVRLTTVENQRIDVEGNLRKQEAALRRLVGAPVGTRLKLTGTFDVRGTDVPVDSLAALARRLRPEIVGASDAANTARLQIEVARTTDNPSLSLNVTGGVKNGFPPELNVPKLNWAGTVRLAVPIFDGNRAEYLEQEAEANLHVAESRLAEAERMVTMEVEQAETDVETSERKIKSADLLVTQAREALALARTRYKAGVITSLELLNAQTALQEAEFQRLQYQYNLATSRYALDRALGVKLW